MPARSAAASPGAAQGAIVFTADDAVAAREEGRAVVLVRPFTEAEDVAGFHAAKGILTSEGGKASHAALVARGMGRPAVTGASALEIDLDAGEVRVGATILRAGDHIAIDGSTGAITVEEVPVIEPEVSDQFLRVLEWADAARVLGVRANADSPEDAEKARGFGAQGIGLCRTEHMFLGDRQPLMAEVILAADREARMRCLEALRPLQQADFEGLFEAMAGLPVTIRLLDPPLHEFLPHRSDVEKQVERARADSGADLAGLERTLERVKALEETNPMLGTRGVRLGILYPEIYRMQADAIFSAARAVKARSGRAPHLEVMIPLVDYERELELMRALVLESAEAAGLTHGEDFLVGTMIELPRAALTAFRIAEAAEFFSFGTNDLTQTTWGFSRDDVEAAFAPR